MALPRPTPLFVVRTGVALAVITVTVLSVVDPSAACAHQRDHSAQSEIHAVAVTVAGAARIESLRPGPAPAVYAPVASRAAVTASSPRVAHESVAPARPTRMRFTGQGFDVTARVCAMPNTLVLTPLGDSHKQVCWVEPSLGVKPGSDTASSYILGHSFGNDPRTVLGTASRLASAQIPRSRTHWRSGVATRDLDALDGAKLTLWTAKGRLEYRVRNSFAVPKPEFGLVNRIEDDSIRHRVVLVTCAVHAGHDLDYNVIVEAFLTSSTRA